MDTTVTFCRICEKFQPGRQCPECRVLHDQPQPCLCEGTGRCWKGDEICEGYAAPFSEITGPIYCACVENELWDYELRMERAGLCPYGCAPRLVERSP